MADIGTREAVAMLGVKPETVSKMCRQNKIPGATQDKKRSPWHIPRKSIEDIINKKEERKKKAKK